MAYSEAIIVCDGSSLNNDDRTLASRAAAVALIYEEGAWRAAGCYLGEATNQQAEIVAAAIGLEALTEARELLINSDSNYVVETMKGNFARKTNFDWWQRLDQAVVRLPHLIEWEWVKGHSGYRVHEIADILARRIARLGNVTDRMLERAARSAAAAHQTETRRRDGGQSVRSMAKESKTGGYTRRRT